MPPAQLPLPHGRGSETWGRCPIPAAAEVRKGCTAIVLCVRSAPMRPASVRLGGFPLQETTFNFLSPAAASIYRCMLV